MTCLFNVIGLVFLCNVGRAQTDDPCGYIVATSDGSCTGNTDCDSESGCVTKYFTPLCTGIYYIEARVDCETGTCTDNQCCVIVKDGANAIAQCLIDPCSGGCAETCGVTAPGAVCLYRDHEYKLYVCLRDCGFGDCLNGDCVATGKVYFASSVTTCP